MKVEIGQEVLVYTIGNKARRGVSFYKGNVTKIGRLWFYVDTKNHIGEREKFSLLNGKCDGRNYMPEYQVFLSEQDYKEEKELPTLRKEVELLLRNLTYNELLNIKQSCQKRN